MGLYARHVLPRIVDVVMRNKEPPPLPMACVPRPSGDVLEEGIDSALDPAFHSRDENRVYRSDLSLEPKQMARKRSDAIPRGQNSFRKRQKNRPRPPIKVSIRP